MKLSVHAWRTLWAYHAWAGIAVGLALHLMFLCGAISVFREPLGVWEEPVQHRAARDTLATSPQVLLERGLAALGDLPAIPQRLWLGLPQGRAGVARVRYTDARTSAWRAGWRPGPTGAPIRAGSCDATWPTASPSPPAPGPGIAVSSTGPNTTRAPV